MTRSPRHGLGAAAATLLLACAASALSPDDYQQCQAPAKHEVWPSKGTTTAFVTSAVVTRTYTCGHFEDGYAVQVEFFNTENPSAPGALPFGSLSFANSVQATERRVQFFEPGNPSKPIGSAVMLQEGSVESKAGLGVGDAQDACYSEPDLRRKVVRGEGIARDLAIVGRRATAGQTKPNCTGIPDGTQANATYIGSYLWFGCSNDPFENPAPTAPLNPDTFPECEPVLKGSVFPAVGSVTVEFVGANITRTTTCGRQGRVRANLTFVDFDDPSLVVGSMVVDSPDQEEAFIEFHAPGNPDEPTGSLVLQLNRTVARQGATQACFAEPNTLVPARDGVGVLEDVRYMLKRSVVWAGAPANCTGRREGEEVEDFMTGAFYFAGCANDPFEGAADQ